MKKLILSLMCVLALIVACKPNYSPSEYKVMTADQVYDFIGQTNRIKTIGCQLLNDERYAVPTVKWINRNYTPALADFLFNNRLRTPVEIENDCDKFTQYGLTVGHMLHRHASDKPAKTALAIGEYVYFKDLTPHAILFFIATDDSGKPVMVFYEPQTQQIIQVDKEAACLHWIM